jgi:hypothetical protein
MPEAMLTATEHNDEKTDHMISKCRQSLPLQISSGAKPARQAHTQTHTDIRFFSVPPPAKQSMSCIATSGASLAAPGGLQTGVPALDTCLTTALEPSSPHSIHCSNKQRRDEPLIVKTPQKPTDRHRTQSQHQPLPAVRAGRGGGMREINSSVFPEASARGEHCPHYGLPALGTRGYLEGINWRFTRNRSGGRGGGSWM